MTLLGYQQALCDLVASPQLCLRVRADPAVLDDYPITARERERLTAVAAQRGMSTSCTLYRVNRITPLYSYLPLTCALLGDDLIHEAERYWHAGKPSDLQFGPETSRFAHYLQQRLEEGAIANPYLGDVLALELAAHALRWGARPSRRRVLFRHDPVALLKALADGQEPDAASIAPGTYVVELDASSGALQLATQEAQAGADLLALDAEAADAGDALGSA